MSGGPERRFKVVHLPGETGKQYPHVADKEGRIIRFGEGAIDGLGGQLFYSSEAAEKAADSLNSEASPEDIEWMG
jgi:hypothetical protein